MHALAVLQWFVDSGKISFLGLFYPNVSPIVKLEWIGSYESTAGREQLFGPPAADVLSACDNLCRLIDVSESRRFVQEQQATEDDFTKAEPYILKLENFINERTDFGDQSWLLGLDYSLESDPPNRWCGAINGAHWTNMQIVRCGSALEQVCRELWEVIRELKCT